jgi:hypothetical protein
MAAVVGDRIVFGRETLSRSVTVVGHPSSTSRCSRLLLAVAVSRDPPRVPAHWVDGLRKRSVAVSMPAHMTINIVSVLLLLAAGD